VAWEVEVEERFWDGEGAGTCFAEGYEGEGRERTEGDVFGYFVVVACFSRRQCTLSRKRTRSQRGQGVLVACRHEQRPRTARSEGSLPWRSFFPSPSITTKEKQRTFLPQPRVL
jgi:hypothetical protein